MKITHYNKLVRDNIPTWIQSMNKSCQTKILSSSEYQQALYKKLEEEVAEFLESKELIELADIIEVIHAIAVSQESSCEEVERLREKKALDRGRFTKKIYLESVTSLQE